MTMEKSEWKGFWVLAEQRSGALHEVGLELVSKAREMADTVGVEVTALLLGQEVKSLVDEERPAGFFTIQWDGKDNQGELVSSGIYVYQLKAGDFCTTKKMVFVR